MSDKMKAEEAIRFLDGWVETLKRHGFEFDARLNGAVGHFNGIIVYFPEIDNDEVLRNDLMFTANFESFRDDSSVYGMGNTPTLAISNLYKKLVDFVLNGMSSAIYSAELLTQKIKEMHAEGHFDDFGRLLVPLAYFLENPYRR